MFSFDRSILAERRNKYETVGLCDDHLLLCTTTFVIDSMENSTAVTRGFNNGSSYLEKENHRIPDDTPDGNRGGEVCVNFIDPPPK